MRALLSVHDKTGLTAFAAGLVEIGFTLLSTGGTAAAIRSAGLPVTDVSEVTGFPEVFGGRVKTLHPKALGGILARREVETDVAEMTREGIEPVDLVVVTLYPFEQTVAKPGVSRAEAIEQIDVGGPTMIRAAAKNHRHVAVVTDPSRYDDVLTELRAGNGRLSDETRFELARAAFGRTAAYDAAIADYFDREAATDPTHLPDTLRLVVPKLATLRYGENPHQQAALYGLGDAGFEQLHGKELSYNNLLDLTAAARLIADFADAPPTVAILKHTNPCGVGQGDSLAEAYRAAFETDREAPFGGVVVTNRPLDLATAEILNEVFTELVVAPDFPDEVLTFLRRKRDRRLIRLPVGPPKLGLELKTVPGGLLVQTPDLAPIEPDSWQLVSQREPSAAERRALEFGWRIVRHVKSNAIVYAAADRTLGVGAGQMSRVDASRLAVEKAARAGLSLVGSAVASDAFFPFADGVIAAAEAGATCVVQPGGSVRDAEVIAAADERGLAMLFTGQRHFRH